ncbi:hypothetical protein LRX75_03830 [Rhizobium sp. DKSPLA3]|uniref:Uncharacterized protein n=1 Tax=Rhizobium quercicola TaxID=2901226 RepID=A0A9X1NR32_9HYPH|nr:hypothetical protein [Rhizobium quercicola]MCD7108169.1 hypothetical protein [Rhizobium quercicola]
MQVEIVFVIVHAILGRLLMMVDKRSLGVSLPGRQGENLRLIHKEARVGDISGELVKKTRDATDRRRSSTGHPQARETSFVCQVARMTGFFLVVPYIVPDAPCPSPITSDGMGFWGQRTDNL